MKKLLSLIAATAIVSATFTTVACAPPADIDPTEPPNSSAWTESSGTSIAEESSDYSDFVSVPDEPAESAPETIPDEPSESAPDSVPDSSGAAEQPAEPLPEEVPVIEKAKYILCNANNVNVRSGPGTGYTSLGQIETGVALCHLGKENGWYKTYFQGKTAYVYAKYTNVLEMDTADQAIEAVISEGYKVLGTPYVYGATRLHDGTGKMLSGFTASKFDCSSLTQYMYYRGAGILLDVTTRTQVKQGKAVANRAWKRGDLLFFTNESRYNNTGVERIGHVAVYLGDNYILHTSSDYAKIEKMSAKRLSYYLQARRFL